MTTLTTSKERTEYQIGGYVTDSYQKYGFDFDSRENCFDDEGN